MVTPLAGVWIEIKQGERLENIESVTPLAGVWIEIRYARSVAMRSAVVTPLAGVWIEIFIN